MFPWHSSVEIRTPHLTWLQPTLRTWTHLVEDRSSFSRIDPRPVSPYQWRSKDALVKLLSIAGDRIDIGAMADTRLNGDFDLFAATTEERIAVVRGQYLPLEARPAHCASVVAVPALATAVSQLNAFRGDSPTPPTTTWFALLFLAPRLVAWEEIDELRNPSAALREVAVTTPEGPQIWDLAIECWAQTGGAELANPWTDGHIWPGVHLLGFTQRAQ
jgi:hypothetical protein